MPNAGDVLVKGELIRMKADGQGGRMPESAPQVENIRSRLAMVFQSFNLWSHMTVLEKYYRSANTGAEKA